MEVKDLNIIPSGEKPIIHASQYDENRSIRFDLKDGADAYTLLAGLVVTCNIKKVDGNIVSFEVENTEGTYIVITLPLQATACAGPNIGEIVISDVSDEDSITLGTINFILEVEKSPMLGGIDSTSDIHDLTEQIEVIVTQVIATDYYTKSEVDDLLEDKADVSDLPDMSDYYDKTEVDNALSLKANISDLPDMSNYYNKTQVDNKLDQKADITDLPDMSDYYTKTAVDNLLSNKADISDLPDMSNYYTKTQIDNKFLDIMPVNNISGAIANFDTLIVAPLVGLKTSIVASGGGGTPSTPISIVGVSEVNLTCADENMQTVDTFTLNLGQTCYGGYVDWKNGKLVVTHKKEILANLSWTKYGSTQVFYARVDDKENTKENYVISDGFTSIHDTVSNAGGAVTKLNADYTIIASKGTNNPTIYVRVDSAADTTELIQTLGSSVCVYELATPIEIDLPTTMPNTIQGVQNWFADSGDIDISFKQDIQNYVDDKTSNVGRSLTLMRGPVEDNTDEGGER